ncbi:DUF4190 domain-containing protein [Pseudokineococcus basanitobsidens]|uniref:DUF4190 domain-containing protein n=1 Tax=Pseudokineococcus basanitobsidens TaxID=1926649 RepID=A0ABU8RIC5_9ACTN
MSTSPQYAGGASAPATGAQRTNTLAIVALVLSFFVSLGGIICGHIARRQIRETGEKGAGLALAALIIGYASLAIGLIVFIVLVVAAGSSGQM